MFLRLTLSPLILSQPIPIKWFKFQPVRSSLFILLTLIGSIHLYGDYNLAFILPLNKLLPTALFQ